MECEHACEKLITKCDAAIAAQKEQIKARDGVIGIALREKQELEVEVEDKTKSLSRYCRNPILTGSTGMAAGALAVVTGPLALLIGGGVIALSCLM